MSINFKPKVVYFENDVTTHPCNKLVTFEQEFSADDKPIIALDGVAQSYEFVAEPFILSKSLIESLTPEWSLLTPCDVTMNRSIKIQAKWHKKKRINKKWLKRYGMKEDFIQIKSNVASITPNIRHDYMKYCDSGIISNWDSYDFCMEDIEYIWRPDQKRRNIKIEW